MDEQDQKVYLNLIQRLLSCRSGEEINILLQQHQQLTNEKLLQMMRVIAQQFEEEGNQQQAQFLIKIAQQLAQYLKKNSSNQVSAEDHYSFFMQTFQLIVENNGDPKLIYPYWEQHQQLLDQTFAQILTNWYHYALSSADRKSKPYLAAILVKFGNLINQFPLGNRAINLEIDIACSKNALLIWTRETFPVQWAMSQHNLASAYLARAYSDRIKGGQADNFEKAISCLENALEIYTPEALSLECLTTARSLGNLGFKERNWQLAIKGYSQAIEAVENLRSEAISEIRRQEIIAEAIRVYQNIIHSYINLGQIDKAIEYAERSKTRDLVELLANRDQPSQGGVSQKN